MTANPSPITYPLTEQEREDWYNTTVVTNFLDGIKPSKHPTFTLITAQSGAGKTTTAKILAQEADTHPARFSGDEIRETLPYATQLWRDNPEEYLFISKPDMSWARERLVDDCMKNGYNIQVDTILSSPNDYKMGTIMRAKEHGYKIECVVIGVPEVLSMVSMYYRREAQIRAGKDGFPVTVTHHDKAYELLPEVVAQMYEAGNADRVRVVNRKFKEFYDTEHTANPTGAGIKAALNKCRESYIYKTTLAYIDTLWDNVEQSMQERKAPDYQKSEVAEQRGKFIKFTQNRGLYIPQQDTNFNKHLPNLQLFREKYGRN
ncbi:MAG: zeta toxin family protein [Alphaproteobacteria bacterium]|nr:zeta toxin family protein [Alphaproteobacteria bacterium]MBQ9235467.1 zeta toxin family protein [Alphaproteobacteria bacterium]